VDETASTADLRPRVARKPNTPSVVAWLKRSHILYSRLKLLRDIRSLPGKAVLRPQTLWAISKVYSKTMLPLVRLVDAYDAVLTVNRAGIAGDIVECGVWSGGCVGLMAMADARSPQSKRLVHLFDSFEGLPQPSEPDIEVIGDFSAEFDDAENLLSTKHELFAMGACVGDTDGEVREFLTRRLQLDPARLVFHKGWFQNTVGPAKDGIGPIAVLRLDGDWYESTLTCLEGLYDRLVPGGFLIIDDYGTFSGCRKAVDEFFAGRGETIQFTYSDRDCVQARKP
jgi:O-methyltransferase